MTGAWPTAIGLAVNLVAAAAADVPRPPPRPPAPTESPSPAAPAQTPPSAPAVAAPAVVPPAIPESCLARLAAAGHRAEAAPQPSTDASCAVQEPVRLAAVADPAAPGRMIALPGAPVLACAFAETFGAFVGEVASPILAWRFGGPLASVQTGPGFQCRSRNNQPGAKPSAHGRGLAIDVAGFTMAAGHALAVRPSVPGPPDRAFAALRRSACGWFTTVLSPGSDGFHTDHMHLDVERHGSSDRYRICQ